jgi:hypothetical protein
MRLETGLKAQHAIVRTEICSEKVSFQLRVKDDQDQNENKHASSLLSGMSGPNSF